MTHRPLQRITGFSIVGPYELDISFADGVSQRVDLSGMLHGELFGPLRDPRMFNAVRLDTEVDNLVWPNGADFDPSTLHDWPDVKDAMLAMAREWAERTPGSPDADDIPETDFRNGIRGKHHLAFQHAASTVTLDADVAEAFPDSEAVNGGLRELLRIRRQR